MSNTPRTDGRDIHSAFLLLGLAFCDQPLPPWPDLTGPWPSGIVYAPPQLDAQSRFEDMPWQLAHAALWQLHANLLLMLDTDEPECVHQARIGWRRLRGTSRLLASLPGLPGLPEAPAWRAVIDQLRELRDVDVARIDVLPRAATRHGAGAPMPDEWRAFAAALNQEAAERRAALRHLLQDAQVGEALWQQVLWLVQLREHPPASLSGHRKSAHLARWASERISDIHHRFERARSKCKDEETLHRTRIWAKRLRYAAEDLKGLLGSKALQWLKIARKVQSSLGSMRDLQMAAALAERHGFGHLAPHILSAGPTPI